MLVEWLIVVAFVLPDGTKGVRYRDGFADEVSCKEQAKTDLRDYFAAVKATATCVELPVLKPSSNEAPKPRTRGQSFDT